MLGELVRPEDEGREDVEFVMGVLVETPEEDDAVPVLVPLVDGILPELDSEDVVAEDGGPVVVTVVHDETVMVEVTVFEVQEGVTVTVTVGNE